MIQRGRGIALPIVFAATFHCGGQDFLLTKEQVFSQQSEAAQSFEGYRFRAEKRGLNVSASVNLPSGSSHAETNIFLTASSAYGVFEEVVSTLSELESLFPPGDYATVVNRSSFQSSNTLSTNLSFAPILSFPGAVPQIVGGTWENGVLLVELGGSINWNPWIDAPEGAWIHMALDHGTGGSRMGTSDTSATGFGLPGSATVGTIYDAQLSFLGQ